MVTQPASSSPNVATLADAHATTPKGTFYLYFPTHLANVFQKEADAEAQIQMKCPWFSRWDGLFPCSERCTVTSRLLHFKLSMVLRQRERLLACWRLLGPGNGTGNDSISLVVYSTNTYLSEGGCFFSTPLLQLPTLCRLDVRCLSGPLSLYTQLRPNKPMPHSSLLDLSDNIVQVIFSEFPRPYNDAQHFRKTTCDNPPETAAWHTTIVSKRDLNRGKRLLSRDLPFGKWKHAVSEFGGTCNS
ncbi:hypothetical protein DL96DRAFT_1684214 [Flagelloscypha sp. PMI_526]|nr:hypothetical protein DL96DRAFT_1684214 [Flagelloscypha sp. PMI_526]